MNLDGNPSALRRIGLSLLCAFCLTSAPLSLAQNAKPAATISLPSPVTTGGKPLMQALAARRTAREFKRTRLPPQLLSNLLWAAFGINRPASGGRTAPSAHDVQEIGIYVVMADGAYLYDARRNVLRLTVSRDLRALTGLQAFVKNAPVNLVYVADFARFTRDSEADKVFYSAADTGFISQNVYLFCASEGLATMVRAYIDKPALARAMRLTPNQHVILAQSVGYAK
jgi:SagB-type dehydrogenase family enzyme